MVGRFAVSRRALSVSSCLGNKAVFIVGAARTPIGSFRSSLASVPAPQLGCIAIKGSLAHANLPASAVQEVFMGQVCQANVGQAPARQAALGAGLDKSTAVTTVNKVCSSGLKSIMLAVQQIQTGHQDVSIGGGMESMSQVPYYVSRGETPYGGFQAVDGIVKDGLTDAYDKCHMGNCGEKTAKEMGFSWNSKMNTPLEVTKRVTPHGSGDISTEVVPVEVKSRKGITLVEKDEEFGKVNFEKFKSLKTVFQKDGTITAANASTLNDGAASVIVASEEAVKKYGLKPLAKVLAYADAARDPLDFAIAPPLLVPKMLKTSGLALNDIDHFEVNEAFSVVVLAFIKELGLDASKVNPHGGAVSLGHPIGMSGARLITHMVHVLKPGQKGMAAICNGGGGSSGMIIEML